MNKAMIDQRVERIRRRQEVINTIQGWIAEPESLLHLLDRSPEFRESFGPALQILVDELVKIASSRGVRRIRVDVLRVLAKFYGLIPCAVLSLPQGGRNAEQDAMCGFLRKQLRAIITAKVQGSRRGVQQEARLLLQQIDTAWVTSTTTIPN